MSKFSFMHAKILTSTLNTQKLCVHQVDIINLIDNYWHISVQPLSGDCMVIIWQLSDGYCLLVDCLKATLWWQPSDGSGLMTYSVDHQCLMWTVWWQLPRGNCQMVTAWYGMSVGHCQIAAVKWQLSDCGCLIATVWWWLPDSNWTDFKISILS